MKRFTCRVALSFLITKATVFGAQTNAVSLVPIDNIAAARSHVKQPELFKIATNTPAFEEYGLNLMLAKANEMRENWKLDIPKPLTVNDVYFSLQATPYGIWGILD